MKKSIWILSLLLLLTSGCNRANAFNSSLEKSLATVTEDKPEMDSVKKCITSTKLENPEGDNVGSILSNYEQKLDSFLMCLVGPDLGDDATKVSAETKQLRAHIIATVIARYAAFNLDGQMGEEFTIPLKEYDGRIDNAEDSLLAITKVERPIRARSGLFSDLAAPDYSEFDPVPSVQAKIESYGRLYRVLHYVDATKKAAKPTVRRARSLVRGVIGSIMSGSITDLKGALGKVTGSLAKLAIVKDLAGSYRNDISAYLGCVESRQTGTAVAGGVCGASLKEDWRAWDKLLKKGCSRLQSVADLEVSCTPGTYK